MHPWKKIIVLAAIVVPMLSLGAMTGSAGAKEKTAQLHVSASVAHVCDVLTTSRAHGFGTFEERLRFWRISILCTFGQNFLVSLQDITDPFQENSEEISTDLYLASGSGTGEWEPLLVFDPLLDASGEKSEIIQLTLIY